MIYPVNFLTQIYSFVLNQTSGRGEHTIAKLDSFLFTFQGFLASMTFASTGGISILPDFLGYGESYTVNRATGIRDVPHQQAFALGYLATKRHIQQITNGCTTLQKSSVTVSGKKETSTKFAFFFSSTNSNLGQNPHLFISPCRKFLANSFHTFSWQDMVRVLKLQFLVVGH